MGLAFGESALLKFVAVDLNAGDILAALAFVINLGALGMTLSKPSN